MNIVYIYLWKFIYIYLAYNTYDSGASPHNSDKFFFRSKYVPSELTRTPYFTGTEPSCRITVRYNNGVSNMVGVAYSTVDE